MIENLKTSIEWLQTALTELEADSALEGNWHWRENLAQTGYQVETLLSEED